MKKKILRIVLFAICVMLLSEYAFISVSASSAASDISVDVRIDGKSFCRGETKLINGTTCVPVRDFVGKMTNGSASITWDGKSGIAYISAAGLTLQIKNGEHYIIANGRYIWCGVENYINRDGKMMTAVRPIAKAFGASVEWDKSAVRCTVGKAGAAIRSGASYYDKDDLYWLSRIINAESRGEPLEGKLAVGAVIYNRVRSDEYPDTVYDVIFDMSYGVQFTPAKTGSIYDAPTEESVIAAKICMEGFLYRDDIMYFCTTEIMRSCWAGRNRPYVMTIGGHAFFA